MLLWFPFQAMFEPTQTSHTVKIFGLWLPTLRQVPRLGQGAEVQFLGKLFEERLRFPVPRQTRRGTSGTMVRKRKGYGAVEFWNLGEWLVHGTKGGMIDRRQLIENWGVAILTIMYHFLWRERFIKKNWWMGRIKGVVVIHLHVWWY